MRCVYQERRRLQAALHRIAIIAMAIGPMRELELSAIQCHMQPRRLHSAVFSLLKSVRRVSLDTRRSATRRLKDTCTTGLDEE